jgi:hypothetical protein
MMKASDDGTAASIISIITTMNTNNFEQTNIIDSIATAKLKNSV